MKRPWPALLGLLMAGPAWAQAPSLSLPVDCAPGRDCFVQNHVDADPGPAARDFTCGPLSYDGHQGMDFRLPTLAEMHRGVRVLSAAPGRVAAIRRGIANDGKRGGELGPNCGIGIRIAHGGDWSTVYCHMRKGSIRVAEGERVRAGTVLGLLGMSGRAEFPHLHFGVLLRSRAIDPHSGRKSGSGCGGASNSLWTEKARARLAYRASGLLGAGFAIERPTSKRVREGGHREVKLGVGSPEIYFWIETFGLRRGDVEMMRLLGPRGQILKNQRHPPRTDNRAVHFRHIGARRKGGGAWSPGRYRGEYRLLRAVVDGGPLETVLSRDVMVRLVEK